jgi:hypothetical protein
LIFKRRGRVSCTYFPFSRDEAGRGPPRHSCFQF